MPATEQRVSLPPRYRAVHHVATGGMASVWAAEDELLGRLVAVKLLSRAYDGEERARRRFLREARAAAKLGDCRHVVTVYDIGEHGDRAFIVMEHFGGGTVADRLAAGRPIPRPTALRWLREAAIALDCAHEHDVVHRDVKPANLLLDRHGRLAVGDFGIATVATEASVTLTGQVLGTAAYISPEQALGQPATAASDRYALAIVAFELLTGARPFPAQHPAAQAQAHVHAEVPAASEVAPDLPPAVDAVLRDGMAKDPADRPATAEALVDRLEAALGDAAEATAPRTAVTRRIAPVVGAGGAGARVGRTPTPPPTPGAATPRSPRAARATHPPTPAPPSSASGRARRGRAWVAALAALVLAAGAVTAIALGGREAGSGSSGGGSAGATSASDRAAAKKAAKERARARARARAEDRAKAAAAAAATPAGTTSSDSSGPGSSGSGSSGSGSSGSGSGSSGSGSSGSGSSGSGSSGRGSGSSGSATSQAAPSTGADPRTLNDRGFALLQGGDPASATPVLQQSVAGFRRQGRTGEIDYAFALFNLATALRATGHPADAVPLLEERLRISSFKRGVVKRELALARQQAGGDQSAPSTGGSDGSGPGSGDD